MQQTIAYGTLVGIVALVLALPHTTVGHRIGPASAACLGVVVLMASGVVGWTDLVAGFNVLWRPFLTILSIMVTTTLAQRLGILDFFAGLIEPRPGQSIETVFRSVFIFSVATATVLNNDAAVLLLTPLIVELIRRCYPHRSDLVIPFAFAVFSAAGVAPLVISNPMNMIVAAYAGIGFNEYAARMAPIALAGWVTAYFMLRVIFRRELRSNEGGTSERPETVATCQTIPRRDGGDPRVLPGFHLRRGAVVGCRRRERDRRPLAMLAASCRFSQTRSGRPVLGDTDFSLRRLCHCSTPWRSSMRSPSTILPATRSSRCWPRLSAATWDPVCYQWARLRACYGLIRFRGRASASACPGSSLWAWR
jgi:hypothetical protein